MVAGPLGELDAGLKTSSSEPWDWVEETWEKAAFSAPTKYLQIKLLNKIITVNLPATTASYP